MDDALSYGVNSPRVYSAVVLRLMQLKCYCCPVSQTSEAHF